MPKKNKTIKDHSLQELILNTSLEKYKLIPIVMRWAKELRKKEENKSLTHSEIQELALKEVLSGKASLEMIEKLPVLPVPKKTSGGQSEKRKK